MPAVEQGAIIVIEGGDGSGKGTQTKLLLDKLYTLGIPHETVDFPRYEDNAFGALVGRYLTGELGDVHPFFASLPYACDRWLAKNGMIQARKQGKRVVSNRSPYSSKAHQAARLPVEERKAFIKWIDHIEHELIGFPREDVGILLNIDPLMGQTNVDKKGLRSYMNGESGRDIHERDINVQGNAREIYLELAKADPRWHVVDCMSGRETMRTPESIHEEIVHVLQERGVLRPVRPLDIYFGCSIRGEQGGQEEKELIVGTLQGLGHNVLSEQFLGLDVNNNQVSKGLMTPPQVYRQDMDWVDAADVIVADFTRISTGLGLEVGWKLRGAQRVVGLCRDDKYEALSKYD